MTKPYLGKFSNIGSKMIVSFNNKNYDIPGEEYERFEYLKRKVRVAQENNWIEMFRGYTVTIEAEFKKYKQTKKRTGI